MLQNSHSNIVINWEADIFKKDFLKQYWALFAFCDVLIKSFLWLFSVKNLFNFECFGQKHHNLKSTMAGLHPILLIMFNKNSQKYFLAKQLFLESYLEFWKCTFLLFSKQFSHIILNEDYFYCFPFYLLYFRFSVESNPILSNSILSLTTHILGDPIHQGLQTFWWMCSTKGA